MMDFIIYDVKAAVILAVFYMFYRLLLSKETFHRLNRVMLLCTAVGSLLLPLFHITIHRTVEVEASPLNMQISEGVLPMIEQTVVTTPWWQILLSTLFILGALAVLIQILISVYKVLRIISGGERRQLEDGTWLVITEKDVSPFSWMHTIVLSRKDYEDDHAAIISHEQAHIRLCHSWDLLLVDLVSLLQWFNPAIWMLRADLCAVHEYEADAQVLDEGYNVKQYQYLLVKKAVGMSGYSVANSFNHRELKSRITMMCRKKSSRSRVLRVLYFLPLIGVCLAVNARTQVNYVEKQTSPSDKVTNVSQILQESREISSPIDTLKKEKTRVEVIVRDTLTEKPAGVYSYDKDDGKVKIRILHDGSAKVVDPLIIVDGERVEDINDIDPNIINSFQVLKDEDAVKLYGDEGKNGVIIIETKSKKEVVLGTPPTDEEMKKVPAIRIRSINGEADSILVIIDGVQKTVKDINELDPLTISSFRVLRDKEAITIYGDEAKHGVIIVTTKKSEGKPQSSTSLKDISDSMRDYLAELQKQQSTFMNPEEVLSMMEKMNKTVAHVEREIRIPTYYDADGNQVDSWKKVRKCVFRNLISNNETEVEITNIVYNDEPISEADISKIEESPTTFHVKNDGTLCVYSLKYMVDKGMIKNFPNLS